MIVFIAYQDRGEMIPANDAGRLILYEDREAARQAAGPLGVPAAVDWERIPDLCRQYGFVEPAKPDTTRRNPTSERLVGLSDAGGLVGTGPGTTTENVGVGAEGDPGPAQLSYL